MAEQLQRQDESAEIVIMYDTPNLSSPAYSPRSLPFPVFQLKRTLLLHDRFKRIRVHLRSWLRRPIRPQDRNLYGTLALIHAAWRHRPGDRPIHAKTLYLGTGLSNAAQIALVGFWDDGAMGWAYRAGEDFQIQRVDAGHNDLPYHPDAIAAVRDALGD